jgi:uncharacterized phage protein (predicted DNA packaging)
VKISEITVATCKEYWRVDGDDQNSVIAAILEAAKHAVIQETGLTTTTADEHPDLTLAVLKLGCELYDKRMYTTDGNAKIDPTVQQITGMHSVNLL